MKQSIILISTFFLLNACNNSGSGGVSNNTDTKPNRDTLLMAIETLESKISNDRSIDYAFAGELVNAYLKFFDNYPKDAFAADCLFKAAEVSMNAKQSEKSIELLAKYIDLFPKSKKTSFSLFLQAFIYETQLSNMDKAKELYSQVIEYYPSTRIADDAKTCIANLGKSEDQLIKEFEEKNKLK